ncbi:hypothetical protein M422DRAFT_243990 [Sphaerobolus stellatus SS14]|nr:hypothetical protein M422DRAFT_243990 [Sphaerobolus stellatus SS14]
MPQTCSNLLASFPPKNICLTKLYDENFLTTPKANTQGKKFWHELILRYEKAVKDYNFGSLIPVDVEDRHSQYIFVVITLQSYTIEAISM